MKRRAPPRPSPDPGDEEPKAARRRRASEESLDVRARSDRPYPSYEVRNPIHGTRYRVLAPDLREEPIYLCPCPDFGRRDVGTCKHVEAVRIHRAAEPEAPPAGPRRDVEGLWRRIDERRARLGTPPLRDLRPLEAIGRVLIEAEGP